MTATATIAPGAWREAVTRELESGSRFAGAWATGTAWRALFAQAGAHRVLTCDPGRGRRVDSIVDIVPAASWDEREAHDLHGVDFDGHEPLRALAEHTDDLGAWTTPVIGGGVHQVAVGPTHAGIIESGHFRFHVVGERILVLDLRLFYNHRGLERAAEGVEPAAGLAVAQRACAACAVTNAVAYAQAVEETLGVAPDHELRIARTVLLELERLYNHLNDIGAICAGVGFAPGTMAFAALKERAQRVNAELVGHRFLFGSVAVGVGAFAADAAAAAAAHGALRELRVDAAAAWRDLEFAGPLQARLDGVGVLGREDALRLGVVGPAARASGVHHDVRGESPQLWYPGFSAAVPPATGGDVAVRLQMRAVELEATCDILDELLAVPVAPGGTAPDATPATIGVGRVESPRGATACIVEADDGRVGRLRLRTGSYANWPAVAHAAADNLLPDFPLINKSFELCYACADR